MTVTHTQVVGRKRGGEKEKREGSDLRTQPGWLPHVILSAWKRTGNTCVVITGKRVSHGTVVEWQTGSQEGMGENILRF
jgi:hypothetical protein